ncbi:MAG: hypothetical protein GY749_47055 [Desulfobacteraceae bacterium]|nr:hypothetical protein [Desulfobacteraceae bacterium]
MNKTNQRFNPEWRDDIFDLEAIEPALLFPDETSSEKGDIWVKTNYKRAETVFDKLHRHEEPRQIVAIVKKSEMAQYYTTKDVHGNILPDDDPVYDYAFPPKAWMTDSTEERCMMYAAAKQARGKVLVGGLGLAVYPQLIYFLKRPVESVTILENNPVIIKLVCGYWKNILSDKLKKKFRVVRGTIEKYLQGTSECFDTIYFDTWEDADPRFLPYVNYLIDLAVPKCSQDGQIQCWGYALMIDAFVRDAKLYAEKDFPLEDFHIDPGLERYSEWLKLQKDKPVSPEDIEKAAREIAMTTIKPLDDYDRNTCYTPVAMSMIEMRLNMERSRKRAQEIV